jgi:hypothetical protein
MADGYKKDSRLVLLQQKREEKERERSAESEISEREIYYNTQIDGLASVLNAADIFVENIALLIEKATSNQERERWQKFEMSFNDAMALFDEFWDVTEGDELT